MKFISDFLKGIRYFFQSTKIIFGKGMSHFLLYPLLLKIILFIGVFTLLLQSQNILQEYLEKTFNFKNIPEAGNWLSWLKPFLNGWLSWLVVKILGVLIFWFLSILMKYVVLILLSPILALASEITEEKLTGTKNPFSVKKLLKDVLRGTTIAFRNMFLEYFLFFIGFFLLLIPGIGAILFCGYGIFMFFVSWYFYGFSMLDYSCERKNMGIKESILFIKKNKGITCGIGFMYALLLALPFFIGDWIGLMFAPIMGVVGATIAFSKI